MMLSLVIAAIVLAAINAVFFGSLKLRASSIDSTQQLLPVDRAVNTIKRDLLGIVPPGTMAGPMGTDATGVGITDPIALELFTTTGIIRDDVPWGDVQKIDFILREPTNRVPGMTGKDLFRGITRNLLATVPDAPDMHLVISNVDNLRFSFFDGTNWNDAWSTTLSNVPVAIKVFLTFSTQKSGKAVNAPIQFLVPVVRQTNQVD
jgi:hypothetical protein